MNEHSFGRREFGDRGYGDRGFGGGRPRFVPVKEGEELDVKIEGVAAKGDGVAKKEGFVIFVPGTKLNDEVHIKITKVARKVAFAEKVGDAKGPVQSDAAPEKEEASEESQSDEEEEPQSAETGEEAEEKQEEASEDDEESKKKESYDDSKDSEEF